jgi:hypothetical protein
MNQWDDEMGALAQRPRTGRFVRDPEPAPSTQRDILSH